MAGDTIITVIGNLTADPEMRFTPSGAAVASFTVASTPRTFDRQAGEWKDGETLFMRCSIWRDAAENVAESLTKGTRVIVQGRLVQRSYTTREGENRTVVEMQVDEIGPSLRYAKAQVTRQGDMVLFTVAADGFLYNMVRIMVGTLLRVQQGKFAPEDIPGILQAKDRKAAGPTAPACGLYLNRVFY